MKTPSKIRIGGTLIPHAARSLARSSRNGYGISGWNRGNSSLPQSCASPDLLQPLRLKLSRKKSRDPRKSPRLRSSMALPNGLILPLPTAFPVQLLLHNRMEHCVAPPTIHCIRRPDVPSVVAPCGSCMPRASAIAAPVLCGHSVKRAAPHSNPDE